MTTEEFIQAHRNEDTASLALRYDGAKGVDMPFALDQIAGFQAARHKIPTWAATPGTLFPARLTMEQCSSEQTARYKRSVAERLLTEMGICGGGTADVERRGVLADLTGGFGVDFTMLAPLFSRAYYVESNPKLCAIVANNLPLFGIGNATVLNTDCEDYIKTMPPADIIYIDPARRDSNGRRTYAITDCTPDIITLLPLLVSKAKALLVKLSPMLDITQTVSEIERGGTAEVAEMHVVAAGNECKELLAVARPRSDAAAARLIRLFCVNDDETFRVDDLRTLRPVKSLPLPTATSSSSLDGIVGSCLYEPNAAIMKAGCFNELCSRFDVRQLDDNSHLFLSRRQTAGFPGRRFLVNAVTTMKKESVRSAFANIRNANVAVRNFPLTAEQLRKRLQLKDGGGTYVFGTTVKKTHLLLICSKR